MRMHAWRGRRRLQTTAMSTAAVGRPRGRSGWHEQHRPSLAESFRQKMQHDTAETKQHTAAQGEFHRGAIDGEHLGLGFRVWGNEEQREEGERAGARATGGGLYAHKEPSPRRIEAWARPWRCPCLHHMRYREEGDSDHTLVPGKTLRFCN